MDWLHKVFKSIGIGNKVSIATLGNLSTLMKGTVISSILPIIFAPIMSRIFVSSDYGVLGLYISVSGLIGVAAFSHYSQAILIAKENEEARQVLWFSLFFCASVSLIFLSVILILNTFSGSITSSSIGRWYFIMPVSILLSGITAIFQLWANRVQEYKKLSNNRMIQAGITIVIQIGLGLLIKNESGLMLGLLVGQIISAVLLIKHFIGDSQYGIGIPNYSAFGITAKKYKNIVIFSTPAEFINNLINQLPVFLLQKFGGISLVGNYNFTQRFLGLPQQFLSSAIVDVFRQKASSTYNQTGNVKEIFVKTAQILFGLAIVPFGLLAFFAPQVFEIVFGAHWREAGILSQYLSILFFMRFIVSPLTFMYTLAQRFKEDFVLHIVFLVLMVTSFYIGDFLISDKKHLILIYAITYSLIYLIYFLRSYHFSKGLSDS